MIKARATVKMQGVTAGEIVYVDPEDPLIARLIRANLLVIEEPSVSREEMASVTDDA